jgi:hypothetical protein
MSAETIQTGWTLSKRILCVQCRGDTKERFDCRLVTSECFCAETLNNCKCCPICRFVVTIKTDSRQFNSFDYNKLDRVTNTGVYECDICDQCKETVYHEYHYDRYGFIEGAGLKWGSESDSNDDENDSSCCANEYASEFIIRVFNTSIHQLHNCVIKRYQQCMRRPVAEKIAVSREKLSLKLGRQLTNAERSELWENYLMFKNPNIS